MGAILVTDATQYAGPGAVGALAGQGARVVCHDGTFHEATSRRAFLDAHPGVECAESVGAADLATELMHKAPALGANGAAIAAKASFDPICS